MIIKYNQEGMVLYIDGILRDEQDGMIEIFKSKAKKHTYYIQKRMEQKYEVDYLRTIFLAISNSVEFEDMIEYKIEIKYEIGEQNIPTLLTKFIKAYLIENKEATFKEVYNYTLDNFVIQILREAKDAKVNRFVGNKKEERKLSC